MNQNDVFFLFVCLFFPSSGIFTNGLINAAISHVSAAAAAVWS